MPKFSVIVPTYNHAVFLERAIRSLQQQSFRDWEAIIVDNHSQDGTRELLEKVTDSRIQFLQVHNNGVIAVSRNAAIRAARGEWLAFLDSDDWWMPEKLEVCVDFLENADFIYHDLKVVKQQQSLINLDTGKTRQVKAPVMIDLLTNGNLIANSSVIVRKKLVESVGMLNEDPKMVGAEDFNCWLKIARVTNRFQYITRFLGFYEFHQSGISRKDMSDCYQYAVAEFLDEIDHKLKDIITAHILYVRARHQLLNNQFKEAISNFGYSLQHGSAIIRVKSMGMIIFSHLAKLFS